MKTDELRPDFAIADILMRQASKIRLVLFDVDGVLTDGRLFFSDSGDEGKSFHARDGLGINLLQQSGVACPLDPAVDFMQNQITVKNEHEG